MSDENKVKPVDVQDMPTDIQGQPTYLQPVDGQLLPASTHRDDFAPEGDTRLQPAGGPEETTTRTIEETQRRSWAARLGWGGVQYRQEDVVERKVTETRTVKSS